MTSATVEPLASIVSQLPANGRNIVGMKTVATSIPIIVQRGGAPGVTRQFRDKWPTGSYPSALVTDHQNPTAAIAAEHGMTTYRR